VGGIWCIVTLNYRFEENQKGSPFLVTDLKPIQMPNMDMPGCSRAQGLHGSTGIDALIRSTGMEPSCFKERVKWHLLARMIPLVENNYNFCELGPRGTGKSHLYKEISPNSILVSGGQTTVANLFYNMAARKVGLVGLWDVVAFDEVAGINFKDHDGVQIMKDYMASGSFSGAARRSTPTRPWSSSATSRPERRVAGQDQPPVGRPFPEAMIDSAFFDRFHAYVPGWEIPKMRPEFFTNQYGLIVDYLAEYLREMRKYNFADAIDKWFKLGNNLNQRDTIAVRRTVSGLLKLICPAGDYDKEIVRKCLEYALEVRRRVKEQLKKIGGMEFYDVHFSYIDLEDSQERFVAVPEQSSGALDSGWPPRTGSAAHDQHGNVRNAGDLPYRNSNHRRRWKSISLGCCTTRTGAGCLRLLQGQFLAHQCIDQARRTRFPPAAARVAECGRAAVIHACQLHCPLLGSAGPPGSVADGNHG
jgi:ATP-dependent Lon protease